MSKEFNWTKWWTLLVTALVVFAIRAWMVMLLLGFVAQDVSWIPALGYWPVFTLMVIINIVVDSNRWYQK